MPGDLSCVRCRRRWRRTRGLCDGYYQQTLRRVHAGGTTWQAEEAAGRALPAQTRGQRDRWHYGPRWPRFGRPSEGG